MSADPRETALCLVGADYADVSDTSMNGVSREEVQGPVVVEPDDRLGPTLDQPERRFYQAAPEFHWHLTVESGVDQAARSVVEQIANDAFRSANGRARNAFAHPRF